MKKILLGTALLSSLLRPSDCVRAVRSDGVPDAVEAGRTAARDEDYERRRRRFAASLSPPLQTYAPHDVSGHSSCPCLPAESLAEDEYASNPEGENAGGGSGSSSSSLSSPYGVLCAAHDINTTRCSDLDDCATRSFPLAAGCDRSWCARPWCYVDPENCELLHRPSELRRVDGGGGGADGGGGGKAGRYYSYATCGYMDSFTYTERLSSLRNKTIKIAFNANTGGWKGAYHPDGNFAQDGDEGEARWEGPIVDFIRRAAKEGGFAMEVMSPPAWLQNQSEDFFGPSRFDYCVYAAALGYLDLCVASYTVSAKRASVTSFFETSDDSVYLIVHADDGNSFVEDLLTVFRPFTWGSWLMIMAFCLPVLGLLMFYHERGATGSAYPHASPVMVKQRETGEVHFEVRRIPMWKHAVTSVYMGILAFFQESYDQSVVTWGGKINLLAISSFVMLVLNVYTANLAAILTDDIAQGEVTSIESAVKAGYNFCAERKAAQTVMDLHDISPEMIVPDPQDLGGDGKPGYNCPNCQARTRVFEYMKRSHDDSSVYCDAALASWEDLQALQASGRHCDKARVGEALVTKNSGIPIFDGVSAELTALLYAIKNDGVLAQALNAAEPTSQCPAMEEATNSLSIQQLTGIWCFSFFFAFVALVVKFFQSVHHWRQGRVTTGMRVRPLQRYDQWGNATCHDIIIDGRLYDPDAVRELHEASSSGSQNDDTEDGGGHDSSDEIMEVGQRGNAAVCRNGASILQGTFNSWN